MAEYRTNLLVAPSFVLLLSTLLTPQAKAERTELSTHSFHSPVYGENLIQNWSFGGAAEAFNELNLLSGPPGRVGHLWNKIPLKTQNADFEIEFQFHVSGENVTASEGFALWYSYESFDIREFEHMSHDWNLFGYRNNFRGLAVFFSFLAFGTENRSSVSFSINHSETLDYSRSVPSGDGVYFGPLRNAPEPYVFKLSVSPGVAMGSIRQLSASSWVDCFKVHGITIQPNGYIGFSASSKTYNNYLFPGDKIVLQRVRVSSEPLLAANDVYPHVNGMTQEELSAVLDHHSSQPGDVAAELRMFSKILYQYISDQHPHEHYMEVMTKELRTTVQHLSEQFQDLQRHVLALTSALTGQQRGSLEDPKLMDAMTTELQGLRNLFHSQSRHQEDLKSSLISLEKSIGAPKADWSNLVERSASLEETIKKQFTYSSVAGLVAIFIICFFVCLFWKRVREMEKKHFL